jgi:serpin B
MRNSRRPAVSLLVLSATLACTDAREEGPPPPPGERVASTLARVTDPAPDAALAQAVAGTTAFALDLHRALAATTDGNLFFSPQSVAFALSMAYAGAAGETAAAFEETLHVSIPEAAHHRAMNDLSRQLASRGEGATGTDGQPFRLRLVNQLFAQRNFPFEAPFLDVLAAEYGADVRLMDFAGAPEPSRAAINGWVAEATEDRIPHLLPEGTIDTETVAVLVNAIYFSAAWATQFRPADTEPRSFTLLDGSTRAVPTMHAPDLPARFAHEEGVDVVELPYDGGELSMLLLVPPVAELASFEAALTAERLDALVGALEPQHLALSMPRFEVRTSASLEPPLSALGLGIAFTDAADLSRMSTAASLVITDVVHEAFVKVDESGTEAAAATAVIVGVTSVPQIRPVTVDRPFLFLVRDDATGTVVFLGRVVAP